MGATNATSKSRAKLAETGNPDQPSKNPCNTRSHTSWYFAEVTPEGNCLQATTPSVQPVVSIRVDKRRERHTHPVHQHPGRAPAFSLRWHAPGRTNRLHKSFGKTAIPSVANMTVVLIEVGHRAIDWKSQRRAGGCRR